MRVASTTQPMVSSVATPGSRMIREKWNVKKAGRNRSEVAATTIKARRRGTDAARRCTGHRTVVTMTSEAEVAAPTHDELHELRRRSDLERVLRACGNA